MRFISLFSGIGGFDLGFKQAGLECALQVDLYEPELIPKLVVDYEKKLRNATTEKEAKKIKTNWRSLINAGRQLRFMGEKQWPNTQRINGVQNVTKGNIPTVDLIAGGFPCQDVSLAGRRAGLAGERSGLWFEFYRIIKEIRPEWIVIENVPGLLSSNGGRDMGTIVRGLAKCGYWWAYRVLDAQYYGVPQRRRRVFIVGCITKGRAQEVLFELDSSPWDTPPSRGTGEGVAITAIRCAQTDSNGWGIKQDGTTGTLDGTGGDVVAISNRNGQIGDIAKTMRGDSHGAIPMVAFGGNNTQGSIDVATSCSAHGSGRYDFESETFVCNTFNGYSGAADDNDAQGNHLIAATLNSGGSGGGFRTEPGEHLIPVGIDGSELGYSLRSNPSHSGDKGDGGINTSMVISQPTYGVRRLTSLEAERLQGFPDDFTAGQSDSARYRQLGNAVTVPVAQWLGKRIIGQCN